MIGKDLLKGTAILSFMNIITQLGSLLLLPIYVSIIEPSMYGIIGVLLPFTTIVSVIFSLGFPTAEARDLGELDENPEQLGRYLFTINVSLSGIMLLGFLILLIPLTREIALNIFGLSNIAFRYVFLAYISGTLMILVNMINVFYNFKKIYFKRAVITVLAFIISNVIALSIIFISDDGAMGKLVGGIVTQSFLLIFLGYSYIKNFKLQFETEYLWSSIRLGIPLVINGIFFTLTDQGNRFVMNQFLPLDIIGKYTLAWTITSPINFLLASFNVVWLPIFFKSMRQKEMKPHLEDYLLTLLIFITLLILILQISISDIARLTLNKTYYESSVYVIIMLPYLLFLAITTLLGNNLIFLKRTDILSVINVVIGLFVLGANFIFIPLYGIYASIWLMLIGEIVETILLFTLLGFKYHIHFQYKKYIMLVFVVLNPITLMISRENFHNLQAFLFKVGYLGIVVALLIFLLPKKKTWILIFMEILKVLQTRWKPQTVDG